jgi:hypothetical protein
MSIFNQVSGFVNGIASGFMGGSQQPAAAADEIIHSPSPLAGSITDPIEKKKTGDPLGFSAIRYPQELGNDELGHYIIFYSLTNSYGHLGRDFDLAKDMGWSASHTSSTKYVNTSEGGNPNEQTSSVRQVTKGTIENLRKNTTPPAQLTNHSSTTKVPANQTVTSAVALYMPAGINVQYKNGYEVEAAELSGDIFRTGGAMKDAETRTKAFDAFLKGFVGASGVYFKQIASGGLDMLGGGDLFRLSTKNIGLAVNPRNEQYYNGPGFRSFSYTFDFYPKNAEEAHDVQKIVKLFKYHSSPAMEEAKTAGRFFIAPSEFEIHYMFKDRPNPHLHKVSRCVCTDVDVRYGPEAQFSTFDDGQPVTTQLTLNFTELEFITKEKIHPSGTTGDTDMSSASYGA